jgi:hypothetical protein
MAILATENYNAYEQFYLKFKIRYDKFFAGLSKIIIRFKQQ